MSEESIENINISDSNFAATFIDHHLLPDTSFNGKFVIKVKLVHNRSTIKNFRHIFYIK